MILFQGQPSQTRKEVFNPAALDSYNDVYYSNAGSGRVRVITGLDGPSPAYIYSMLWQRGIMSRPLSIKAHHSTSKLYVSMLMVK